MAQSSISTFFTQQELNRLKSAFEVSGLKAVVPLIQMKVNELHNTGLNIAVTGESGSGKSIFINAMRGLQSSDEEAARSITAETTMEPIRYTHPNMPIVYFWDLPGIGAINFPADVYLQRMDFNKYDFFIIISDCQFRENDAKLAKEVKQLGKNVYFVQSKIDNDLHALEQKGRELNTDVELDKIRNDCVINLENAGFPSPTVFLISNCEVNNFDFPALKETLENDLGYLKKHVFLMSLQNTTLEIIEKKRVRLKALTWLVATLSGTVGAVPVPGLSVTCDIAILMNTIIYFRKHLGLDAGSLQRLANTVGKPVKNLEATVKTPLFGEINKKLVEKMLVKTTLPPILPLKKIFSCIPIIGPIVGFIADGVSSFGHTNKLLNDALDDLAENARRVVKIAFGSD